MVQSMFLAAAAASLLFSMPTSAAQIYSKNSPVLQVDYKSYDKLIAQSNHTSVANRPFRRFYAPWCGHCQNLKPAYEKAATNLKGLAKVAAINCDEAANKEFCGGMGVQGFPTLKIVKPGKKAGRPIVEDYQGPRSAKGIVDAVVDKIPNHVKRVQDKDLDAWLEEGNSTAKAILFTEKGSVSALLKSLAIDFLGSIKFGQIRNSNEQAVETFGITKYPTLVLLPGGDKDGILYDGEMKKEPMTSFLSQVASPNPDPAPAKAKSSKKDSSKSKSKSASSADTSEAAASASVESDSPLESPDPNIVDEDTPKPVKVESKAPPLLMMLESTDSLQSMCLTRHSPTCILALLPAKEDEAAPLPTSATEALKSLGEIQHKHKERSGKAALHFYSVPAKNELGAMMRSEASDTVEIVALNAKRRWVKRYGSDHGFDTVSVEAWVDDIRMGEGKKESLPESVEQSIIEGSPKAAGEPVFEMPEGLNLEDLMKGGGENSPLKVEFLEELNEHDEL
ncbi:thioredoxin-domain-containing protein [Rhizodiscina lignyota]|uniref:protein disulfide-isomerase n=1 Tax=Rhizodiscina lignyota TaxID=1504668 RepID=A0A9P4IAT9_9PEZI|nr:thioredoxin-domain-containing protein [Rhizodiscina lignyota]